MKNKFHQFLLLLAIAMMAAFTWMPPAHQVPDNNRFVPEVVHEIPPVAALTLTASDIKAPKNSEACVSVTARDFQNILSMQYTMQWDPKVLKFKAVQNYGLPGMKDNNFSDHLANEGKLTFSWYDPRLVGLTQPEGVKLYDVCFDIVGKPGTASKFEFTGIPTVIEIADARGTFLDLRTEGGAITVED
ncbi:MAG: hypothetical protein H6577_15020 [Lewinellaceae bacterium]|nr:hypothetical protein [Saprospiraceae bacterium]MCB9339439.1 hypothetical protein [Lewinellaceae bacterium]